jgi:adenosylcobinamide-GDP ribazoletransferase
MIRPLATAFAFLTRLPVMPRDLHVSDLGRSIAWFPFVGLLLGVVASMVARLPLDAGLRAIAIVALGAFLTGGLHLDGVADVADGLGGGRGDRARSLAIMKDSRIGAFGAIALVLVLLAKVRATSLVLDQPLVLLVAPVVARGVASALIVAFPYARPEGLGRAFHDYGRPLHAGVAIAFATAAALVAHAPVAAAAATFAAVTVALWIHHRLGGLTGDAYGTVIEAAELTLLIGATISP